MRGYISELHTATSLRNIVDENWYAKIELYMRIDVYAISISVQNAQGKSSGEIQAKISMSNCGEIDH